jgi:hypothetical protein
MSTYCVLNPTSEKDTMIELSPCGINIMMNKSNSSTYSDIVIFLKGQVYNIQTWISNLHLPLETTAEDVIIHLYKTYGIEYTLQVLDGVFCFILFDYYYENIISNVYIVKDALGIIPFYCFTNNKTILFTNSKLMPDKYTEHVLYPGSYTIYDLGYKVNAEWVVSPIKNRSYFVVPNSVNMSTIDNHSVSLYDLHKCMKKTILNIVYITNQNANNVVEKLFSQMNSPQDKHDDIVIYDIDHKRYIHISPMNFFIDPTTFSDMFEYDYRMRKQLQLSTFEPDKIYPFYDKSFVQLYFSIPLHMRYHYHKQLFSIDKI